MKRLVLLLALAALVCSGAATADDEAGEKPRFPNLQMSSLDGRSSVELASFRGRPVLITFWATWCRPCRVELPELEKLYGELVGKGFVLLTINVDHNTAAAARFLESTGLRVPVYRLDYGSLQRLGINSIPTNVLLDRDGRPAAVYSGYTPTVPDEIRRLVLEMDVEGEDAGDGG
jgi:thiol-disulfide isomerase/thioredoxin